MDIAEEQLEKIRFTIEVQFREQLVRRAEFPFLQSIGLKDIFQGFTNPDGTYLGMLHLVWSSGTTWRSSWIDTHEEGEDLIRKIYREKPEDTEKLISIHHLIEIQRQQRVNVEHEMEHLSLIHISEPTRRTPISYAVFCLKK